MTTCTSAFEPVYLAQNPAISGYRYGWESCAAFAGAEAASYASCGAIHPSGMQVRNKTNEAIPDPNSPGLTIVQVADALAKLGVRVTPFLRMSWSQIRAMRSAGYSFSLCVGYSVIRPTRFSGDPSFYGGHQIWYPPTGKNMDALCDGRRAGIYKYHGEVYPDDLIERAAGAFRVTYRRADGSTYAAPIGFGWAQGFYTIAHPTTVPVPPPVSTGGDMAIATGGLGLTSKYVIDLPAGQVVYATPATTHPLTSLHAAAAPLFTGNVVGGGWRAIQVTTGAPYSDGVSRPTQVYIPYAAGTPRLR